MGNKYASIHVYIDDQDRIIDTLKQYYKKNPAMPEIYKKALSQIYAEKAEKYIWVYSEEPTAVITKRFISIYDSYMDYGSVRQRAHDIAMFTGTAVAYASNYDDDFLIYGAYTPDDSTGGFVSSEGTPEDFLLEDMTEINIEKFLTMLNIIDEKEDVIKEFSEIKEIDDMVAFLDKLLQVRVSKRKGDISRSKKKYEQLSSGDGLILYDEKKL